MKHSVWLEYEVRKEIAQVMHDNISNLMPLKINGGRKMKSLGFYTSFVVIPMEEA